MKTREVKSISGCLFSLPCFQLPLGILSDYYLVESISGFDLSFGGGEKGTAGATDERSHEVLAKLPLIAEQIKAKSPNLFRCCGWASP